MLLIYFYSGEIPEFEVMESYIKNRSVASRGDDKKRRCIIKMLPL